MAAFRHSPPLPMGANNKFVYMVVGAALSLLLLVQLTRPMGADCHLPSPLGHLTSTPEDQLKPSNRTLGFEKVYVINLPDRSDKRDAMSLAVALTNITIEYSDGVMGETIPYKALPHLQESRPMPENFLGSWRAHMNIIRGVVEKGISSALIIEDDSDWDVRIKDQLTDFALGARWLQGLSPEDVTHSPYGDNWDVLWVGMCMDNVDLSDDRSFVIHNDPSAPDYRELYHPYDVPPDWMAEHPPHSRIIHPGGDPMCTFAYAVSQQGARKILYNLAVKELQGNFDNALAWMCRDKPLNARCISVYPSLFHTHKAAGPAGKNSDNTEDSPEESEARTDEIQWPVKTNFEKLLLGRTDFVDHYPIKAEEVIEGNF